VRNCCRLEGNVGKEKILGSKCGDLIKEVRDSSLNVWLTAEMVKASSLDLVRKGRDRMCL
jgi:hypothetical protein